MIAVFDANILIDYLREIPQAHVELDLYDVKAMSLMTWIEVMVGAADRQARTRNLLASFETMEIDQDVAERATMLRRTYRIKLPDAIIWATAQAYDLVLVTRNSKDFPLNDPSIRIPYLLK